jgi:hypothetical protein
MSAQGTIIAVSPDPYWPDASPSGSSLAFVNISELLDLNPPEMTRKAIETTTHNESDDRIIVGIRRKGEVTFKINFNPNDTTHDETTGLQKKWKDGSRDIYKITYPDSSYLIFSGYVVGIKPSAPVDDKLTADITIKPTGGHIWG